MRGTHWIAMAIMLGIAGSAAAQDNGNGGEGQDFPPFKKVDQDESGKLSLEEAKKVGISEDKFQEEDLDNDGKLTKYDYKYGIK